MASGLGSLKVRTERLAPGRMDAECRLRLQMGSARWEGFVAHDGHDMIRFTVMRTEYCFAIPARDRAGSARSVIP